MDENTTWLLISIAVGAGAIPAGYAITFFQEYCERQFRPSNSLEVLHIACASISKDLIPLISGLPRKGIPLAGATLRLYGNDARYLVKGNGRQWRNALRRWDKKGLRIKYVLLNADATTHDEMIRLQKELDHFEASVANRDGVNYLVKNGFDTYHPTLFLSSDENQRAAWLEGLHRPDSEFAYDVEYVSPAAMKKDKALRKHFDDCLSKMKYAMLHCDPIATAPCTA